MNIISSIFLGILQGLTEFLPVSSSGHLVLAQSIIPGFVQPGVLFDVVLHAGTLFAIVFYFRKNLFKLLKKYFWLLVIGTIPAGLVGFFLSSGIEALFESTKVVGFALLLTGIFNLLTDKAKPSKENITKKQSLLIGTFQALAIIPGVSRSGSTIFAGVQSGTKAKKAAEFSFILSLPAVFGATVLELMKHGANTATSTPIYIVGFIAAFISGFIAIKLIFKILEEKRFELFAYYCFILGALAILI